MVRMKRQRRLVLLDSADIDPRMSLGMPALLHTRIITEGFRVLAKRSGRVDSCLRERLLPNFMQQLANGRGEASYNLMLESAQTGLLLQR